MAITSSLRHRLFFLKVAPYQHSRYSAAVLFSEVIESLIAARCDCRRLWFLKPRADDSRLGHLIFPPAAMPHSHFRSFRHTRRHGYDYLKTYSWLQFDKYAIMPMGAAIFHIAQRAAAAGLASLFIDMRCARASRSSAGFDASFTAKRMGIMIRRYVAAAFLMLPSFTGHFTAAGHFF